MRRIREKRTKWQEFKEFAAYIWPQLVGGLVVTAALTCCAYYIKTHL